MKDKPWRSPFVDFEPDPLTTSDLLEDVQDAEGRSDDEICRDAIGFFMQRFSEAAQGMSKDDRLHEALWARWVDQRAELARCSQPTD